MRDKVSASSSTTGKCCFYAFKLRALLLQHSCDVTWALTLAGGHWVWPLPTVLALKGWTPDKFIACGAGEVGRVSIRGPWGTHTATGGSSEWGTGHHCREGRGIHQHRQKDSLLLKSACPETTGKLGAKWFSWLDFHCLRWHPLETGVGHIEDGRGKSRVCAWCPCECFSHKRKQKYQRRCLLCS